MFSCKIYESFKNTFFDWTPLVAASEQIQKISVVHCMAKWCSGHLAQVYLSYSILCHTADGIARDLSKSRVPLLVSKIENEHLLKIYAIVEQVQLHQEKNDSYVCHKG